MDCLGSYISDLKTKCGRRHNQFGIEGAAKMSLFPFPAFTLFDLLI